MPTQKTSWLKSLASRMGFGAEHVAEVANSPFNYGDTLSQVSLMGSGVVDSRNRQQIYAKYQRMMADPIVSGAIRNHVTAALGGHETTGDVVFLEVRSGFKGDKKAEKMVAEMTAELGPLLNKIATLVAYNGVGFGDAYARIYPVKGKGIVDISVDEMLLPPLVQPFEKGNKTVVCEVAVGAKLRERLVMNQIARLKMPRLMYTPQPLAVEKAWRVHVAEDDIEKLPIMPSLVGGSFLADAETQFDKFIAAMQGLVGQRVLDSIDESIFTVQVQGMTKEQRDTILSSAKAMLSRSKELADKAVTSGLPVLGRHRHLLPVWGDKQLVQVQGINTSGGGGGGRAGNISVEDVMLHAKLLAGALGTDITMLGFADMMSGGLGDGGFFRTSVQAAERSRTIRVALSEFYQHIASVHCMYRYGYLPDADKLPWQINFYGSISALETERERTSLAAINAGMLLLQTLTLAKESGLDEASTAHLLERVVKLDKEDAAMYARAQAKAAKEAKAQMAAEGGFAPPQPDPSDPDGDGQPGINPAGPDGT